MIIGKRITQTIIADNLPLVKHQTTDTELLQQSVRMTSKDKRACRFNKFLHALLRLGEEAAIAGSETFIQSKAFMPGCRQERK
jgi:hypothetical protein